MASPSIQVVGAKELRAAIKRAEDAGLTNQLRQANKSAAAVVVERALPQVPVRSGALRRSVRALAAQASAQVRAGSAKVDYAAAIHWGRKRGNVGSPPGNHPGRNPIRGRPFLWNAAQQSTAKVIDVYRDAMGRLAEEIEHG